MNLDFYHTEHKNQSLLNQQTFRGIDSLSYKGFTDQFKTYRSMQKGVSHIKRKLLPLLICVFLSAISNAQSVDSIPKPAKAAADSATVYVSFMVETTGEIKKVGIYKIECPKCGKKFKEKIKSEAIRVIKAGPSMPPRQKRVMMVQPIKFILEDE
ncbi:MAG TPA: hypothetical protein VLA58_08255 [Chitinophagaceae bacterium]|nr:hypothetical protein [Chitinophagaceae bacterium]